MSLPNTLFEVSWEVCNKVGGIHTVVSTKARTLVEELDDNYICIGPWLLTGGEPNAAFVEEACWAEFCDACRADGIPVRVGRWNIPGRPRAILVEFSGLYARKDEILAKLWEDYQVDSLSGGWDYVEPVLFGWAAGMVVERWRAAHPAPKSDSCVAQFHEWMTGAGLLHLKKNAPTVGTVFTTHATILGRSVSSGGVLPEDGLAGRTSAEAAKGHNITAKHSIEQVCAREADVFTTVSEVTADEAELYFGRRASPLLPNGIDLSVIDEMCGQTGRDAARARLFDLASRMVGEDCSDAQLVATSGRYEFHNKGIDLLLEAAARLEKKPGRKLVLFAMVPGGQSGVRSELLERLSRPVAEARGTLGVSTHNLFEPEGDPIQRRCKELGLANAPGSRVKVVQVPIYLSESDGFLNLPYEAVLRAFDVSAFPSFYEPWGYTPEESLAVGVPTITSDLAGFGRWALEKRFAREDGVVVLPREERARRGAEGFAEAADELCEALEALLADPRPRAAMEQACRATASAAAWTGLVRRYHDAFDSAAKSAAKRAGAPAFAMRTPRTMEIRPTQQGGKPRLMAFTVSATMPRQLEGLERLVRNYWWSWDSEAAQLLSELQDRGAHEDKWKKHDHNPVPYLRELYPDDLSKRAADPAYVARLEKVLARFDAYMARKPQGIKVAGGAIDERHPVAYFCAEFGIHESLKIYSGGLGILAGDHLKSASDMGLPLVGIGLFYRKGYLRQRVTAAGDQVAGEIENDPRDLPIEPVLDENGRALTITLQLPSSDLVLRAWKVQVGRVPLYLLDSDQPENRPEDREITRQLYGGDHEMRLRQEIVLGRGGKRLLTRLGIHPCVFHINEGHAAFLVLERVSRLVREHGLTYDEAREFVRATTVFTTHTPVPAGHDRFGEEIMRRYFSDAASWVGLPWERFWALGTAEDDRASFNMTYLAMNFAAHVNGVSKLHGDVSRELLHPFWPRLLRGEVPVSSVTNGVHLPSWTSGRLAEMLGAKGRTVEGADFAAHAAKLTDAQLLQLRRERKKALVDHLKERIEEAHSSRDDSTALQTKILAGLKDGEDALWIAFARRFAPYKRANLLFSDPARLLALLSDARRPVKIVFAGKAHPRDTLGQEILKQVVEFTRRPEFVGKVHFVEDYDIELARHLVQGVDVWLNNPIRPLEASGTSGMKVAANGGLNVSIPDGWWVEAQEDEPAHQAQPRNGWTIGHGRAMATQERQDELDAEALYNLLEEEVVPTYFDLEGGVRKRWLACVRRSLATIPPVFDTDRMVGEYRDAAYKPLAGAWHTLREDRFNKARTFAARGAQLRKSFAAVRILSAQVADVSSLRVGDEVEVRVRVDMGQLTCEDLAVELVLGHQSAGTDLRNRVALVLDPEGAVEGGVQAFVGRQRLERSGSFGYGIRVRTRGVDEHDLRTKDMVLWG